MEERYVQTNFRLEILLPLLAMSGQMSGQMIFGQFYVRDNHPNVSALYIIIKKY